MTFRRLDHIGVIVANLPEAQRWLGEVFGLPVRRTVEIPEGQIHAAFFACGAVDIELIEIGDPEVRRRRLGTEAKARIEHIAVEVEDLQETLAALAPLGVRTTAPEPRRVGDTLNVWTVADTTGGISYQLIERRRPPLAEGAGAKSPA